MDTNEVIFDTDTYNLVGLDSPTGERQTGEWIHFAQSDDCSVCGYSTGKYGSPSKFCPNCGADLRGSLFK